MAKAYNGVKESDLNKSEVADVMMHLYFRAQEQFNRDKPPEVGACLVPWAGSWVPKSRGAKRPTGVSSH